MSYFHPIHARNHTVMPGVGKIHTHSVGNTSYTTGLDHYFLAEGAEKRVAGSVRFSAFVDETGRIAWRFVHVEGPEARRIGWKGPRPTEQTQTDFPAAAIAEMRRLCETLQERDQTGWFFHALGAVDMELRDRVGKQDEIQRAVDTLARLLADPNEPKKHFVTAEQAGADKGFHRPATTEEKTERRADWTGRLANRRAALAVLTAEQADRVALLTRLRDTLRDWSGRKAPRTSPYDLYARAIAA